jgi:hypothetical protein
MLGPMRYSIWDMYIALIAGWMIGIAFGTTIGGHYETVSVP